MIYWYHIKNMGIIVDLILVAILAAFISIGYKKGLTGSLLKLVSFAVAIVLAILLYKPLANAIIDNTKIDEGMENSIIVTFSQEKKEKSTEQPTGIQNTIMDTINQEVNNAATEARNSVIQQSANKITRTIINIASAIIIYIVARIILLVVSLVVKGITELPVIKQADKIGGAGYGILEGMLIIFILLGIISFATVLWPDNIVAKAVAKSALGNFLYNNNIILKFFFK